MLRRSGLAPVVWLGVMACCVVACGNRSSRSTWLGQQEHQVAPATAANRQFPALTATAARAKLAAARRMKKPADAVVVANRLAMAGQRLTADEARYVAAAVDRLAGDALAGLWKHLDKTYVPAPRVALRLALGAYHVGDLAAASSKLQYTKQLAPALSAKADRLAQKLAAQNSVVSTVVAVVLPLSGTHAAIGAELRTAIRIASRSPEGRGVTVRFVDTQGTQAGAVAAVDKAVFEHHAIAIVGPVGARESRAAAARATELDVPIALLSAAGAANSAAGVFRLWSSSGWEAREAVRIAKSLGYDRFAAHGHADSTGGFACDRLVGPDGGGILTAD